MNYFFYLGWKAHVDKKGSSDRGEEELENVINSSGDKQNYTDDTSNYQLSH